ncbi:MAG: hypothetical protein NZ455_14195 [Bacteroidia bacterium]|nr:hypothetical protein [Bacteroidia bacterium]MDW8348190.1 hypothetical protein [Bacteroidia bacterium]
MREACGGQAVRLGAKPHAHALNPITRGWAGGAQHRQPAARRPCPHEQSEPWARTRPKIKKI